MAAFWVSITCCQPDFTVQLCIFSSEYTSNFKDYFCFKVCVHAFMLFATAVTFVYLDFSWCSCAFIGASYNVSLWLFD